MKIHKGLTGCLIAVLGVITGFGHTVSAKPLDILTQVHQGADVVVVVPSLRQLSDKITLLANELGLGAQLPPDPLMMLKMLSGLGQGLSDNENVAMVLWNLEQVVDAGMRYDLAAEKAKAGNGPPPAKPTVKPDFALLIPVAGAKDFIANIAAINPTALDNGLTQIRALGDTLFIKPLGDQYILAGQNPQSLLKYQPAQTDQWTALLGKVASDYTDKSDLIVLMNPKSFANVLNKNMRAIRESIKTDMDKQAQRDPKFVTFRPLIQYYANLLLQAAQSMLNDTTGMAMGLTISPTGISTGLSMQFKSGSTMNQILAKSPKPLSQFDSLPNLQWVSLTQFDGSQLDAQKMLRLIKMCFPQGDIVPKEVQPTLTALNKVIENYTLYKYSYQQMQLANTTGQMQMITAIPSQGEAKKAFYQIRQMMGPMVEVFSSIISLDEKKKDLLKLTFKQDALQAKGGTQTDTMTLSSADPAIMQAFTQAFGASNMKVYTSYNDAGIVSVIGDDKLLELALTAISEKQPVPAIQTLVNQMRPNLPANRIMESYLNLPNYLKQLQATMLKQPQGMQVAMMIGMFQLPADLPPIVSTASNVNGGLRVDSFIPMQTIALITQKGMAMSQMMTPAPGTPGPATPATPPPASPPPAPASPPAPLN